jgi:hypothetical protein
MNHDDIASAKSAFVLRWLALRTFVPFDFIGLTHIVGQEVAGGFYFQQRVGLGAVGDVEVGEAALTFGYRQ